MPPENVPEVTEGQTLSNESKKVKTNQSFESLFDCESLCDVILNINDGQFLFRGHKMILGLKSEILATMLNELSSSESQSRPVLNLKEVPECSMVFSRFLYFIYSGAVWLHRDYVLPLHSLAEKYQVKPLIQHCQSYISQILYNMINSFDGCRGFSIDIICDIYEGNLYSDEICDLCYKVLCAKFRDLIASERWSLCSWHLVSDLLKCDDCNAEENVILTSATEWMKKNQLADKNLIEDILVNIRYPLLHRKVLYQLQKNGIFKNFPQVQELVENAVRYHCFKDVPEAREEFAGVQFTKRTTYRSRPSSTENNSMNSPETLSSSNQNMNLGVHSQNHCSPAVFIQNSQPPQIVQSQIYSNLLHESQEYHRLQEAVPPPPSPPTQPSVSAIPHIYNVSSATNYVQNASVQTGDRSS
jgi:hypothetical protein